MRILVPIKRIADTNAPVRLTEDGTGIDMSNVRMVMNPFCENALEEALKIKATHKGTEVVAVTIGSEKAEDILRTAFALGADRCVLIQSNQDVESFYVAQILSRMVIFEKPALIIMGKQSCDTENNQTAQMMAGLLGYPQAIGVTKLNYNNNKVQATYTAGRITQVLELCLPCVISADLSLNKPRHAALPKVMQARAKKIEYTTVQNMGVDVNSKCTVEKLELSTIERQGKRIESISDLQSLIQKHMDVQ